MVLFASLPQDKLREPKIAPAAVHKLPEFEIHLNIEMLGQFSVCHFIPVNKCSDHANVIINRGKGKASSSHTELKNHLFSIIMYCTTSSSYSFILYQPLCAHRSSDNPPQPHEHTPRHLLHFAHITACSCSTGRWHAHVCHLREDTSAMSPKFQQSWSRNLQPEK